MPMGDELKELLKEGVGDISLENIPTSQTEISPTPHAVILALFMYACSDSAMSLLSWACYMQ